MGRSAEGLVQRQQQGSRVWPFHLHSQAIRPMAKRGRQDAALHPGLLLQSDNAKALFAWGMLRDYGSGWWVGKVFSTDSSLWLAR